MLTYPIECFVIREVLETLSQNKCSVWVANRINGFLATLRPIPSCMCLCSTDPSAIVFGSVGVLQSVSENVKHYGFTVVVCIAAMAVSVSLKNLGIVLELNGIIFANLLAFILPGLCAIKQLPGDHWYSRQKWGPICLVAFGVAVRCPRLWLHACSTRGCRLCTLHPPSRSPLCACASLILSDRPVSLSTPVTVGQTGALSPYVFQAPHFSCAHQLFVVGLVMMVVNASTGDD